MTLTQAQQLYALHGEQIVQLDVPQHASDPARVHDGLPLGVYEAARTFDHDLFVGLAAHLDRMERSIGLASLAGGFDRTNLCRALDHAARNSPSADSKIRFDHLAGPATALGSDAHVVLQVTPLDLPPDEVYTEGVGCQLTELQRTRPEVKGAKWVLERRAAEGGESNFESILVDEEGRLLEGTMSNLFWCSEGTVYTAPVGGVLPGITRSLVIELARGLGLLVREQNARVDALDQIDEAFLTTSVRSVVPIRSIAAVKLGSPGPLTKAIAEAYEAHCQANAAPAYRE